MPPFSQIRAIDLFCGVGGLTHGLERGGVNVVAGLDLDAECQYAFEANNSAKFVHQDVEELTAQQVRDYLGEGAYTLIAGCAPCQPFSTYSRPGQRGGERGDWRLVDSFGRLVREVQPDFVTMENVPALKDHAVFNAFLASLEGYSLDYKVIQCSEIGVPQTRNRLVLVASRIGSAAPSLDWPQEEAVSVRDAIGGLPSLRAGETSDEDPLHKAPRLSELNLQRIRASKPGGTWRDWPDELRAVCHRRSSGSTFPSVYGRMDWNRPAPTITTQFFGYGNGRFGHPEQDRAITPREAAILQTFPKRYQFVRPGERVRFSTLGRLIGNAVPVRLGERIASSLFAQLQHEGHQPLS